VGRGELKNFTCIDTTADTAEPAADRIVAQLWETGRQG